MDWIHPWIGLDWVQFLVIKFGLHWVRSFLRFIVFPKTEAPSSVVFSFVKMHFGFQAN